MSVRTNIVLNTTAAEIGAPAASPMCATRNGTGINTTQIPSARFLIFSGCSYTHASSCGTRKIPVSVKSKMKIMSQAGRDQLSGDQIIVPKLVTRSSRMWLKIPTT